MESQCWQDYALSDFDVIRALGAGSFGSVQQVVHKRTGGTFAMKVIEKRRVVEHSLQEQLQREVLTQMKARHPNVVKMYYYFEEAGKVHCLLEFADKGHLFSYLTGWSAGLPEPKAANFFSDVAHGLSYLHGIGVVHRDIKPENILLFGEDLRAKICDLGWCVELTDDRPDRQTFCGTMDYLSPEMWLNEGHDTGVDIWALGVLLYEMILAKAPFTGESHKETVDSICAARPNIPEGVMSRGAQELVLGLLRRYRQDRLSMADLLEHPWVTTRAGSIRSSGDDAQGLDATRVARRVGQEESAKSHVRRQSGSLSGERDSTDVEETLRCVRKADVAEAGASTRPSYFSSSSHKNLIAASHCESHRNAVRESAPDAQPLDNLNQTVRMNREANNALTGEQDALRDCLHRQKQSQAGPEMKAKVWENYDNEAVQSSMVRQASREERTEIDDSWNFLTAPARADRAPLPPSGRRLAADGRLPQDPSAGAYFPPPRRPARSPPERSPRTSEDGSEDEPTLQSAGSLVFEFISGFFAAPEPPPRISHRSKLSASRGCNQVAYSQY